MTPHSNLHTLAAIGVMSVVTILLRATPFLALRRAGNSPTTRTLASVMPPGVMVILVAYSVRSVDFSSAAHALPALGGIAATAAVHHRWRNPLAGILSGTLCYVLLLHLI